MRRQIDPAIQDKASRNISVDVELGDFTCPVTQLLFFDPVVTECGHYVERAASTQLQNCPCCMNANPSFKEASPFFKNILEQAIVNYKLYKEVYFNYDAFENAVRENKLNTSVGQRFLTLLENSEKSLNEKPIIQIQEQTTDPYDLTIPEYRIRESFGKSAIEILSSTPQGRDSLRKKLKIGSEKFLFGNTEILPESLQLQVDKKSIREWLSMTTAMEKMEKAAIDRIDTMENEVHEITLQKEGLINQFRLFLTQGTQQGPAVATAGYRKHSDAVTPLLQQLVYGNECNKEDSVKTALEAIKTNSNKLSELLCDTSTVTDYSGRTITEDTLLRAALRAGDVEMCQMLIPYFYLIPEGRQELEMQFSEVFPEGIETHELELQGMAFNFNKIMAAFRGANLADRQAALDEFRRQFTELSNNEKIFNLHHLLQAFEAYSILWGHYKTDATDRNYAKRNEFWCKIIGFIQRFMPACYAQACAQGLYNLVRVDQLDSWSPEALQRSFDFKSGDGAYFPLSPNPHSGLGFDFAIFAAQGNACTGWPAVWACRRFFQELLSSKNSKLSELYTASVCAEAQATMNELTTVGR